MVRWEPVRCRIPELLKKLGKTQRWLASEVGLSESNLSDYVHMRDGLVLGLAIAKTVAIALKIDCIDDLYEWVKKYRG